MTASISSYAFNKVDIFSLAFAFEFNRGSHFPHFLQPPLITSRMWRCSSTVSVFALKTVGMNLITMKKPVTRAENLRHR